MIFFFFFKKGLETFDLTLVSQYPRLTLAVWYLMFQAAVKSINRCQPPPRSKQREGGGPTRPPATWPGVIWTRPPMPQKSCSLNHSACKNNQVNLYSVAPAQPGSTLTHRTTVGNSSVVYRYRFAQEASDRAFPRTAITVRKIHLSKGE